MWFTILTSTIAVVLTIYIIRNIVKAKNLTTSDALALLGIVVAVILVFYSYPASTANSTLPVSYSTPSETDGGTEKSAKYRGRVLDAVSGEPVNGATVNLDLENTPYTRYTDNEGVYEFVVEPLKSKISGKIRITAKGYRHYERVVELNPGSLSIEDIRLEIDPTPSPTVILVSPTSVPTRVTVIRTPTPRASAREVYGGDRGKLARQDSTNLYDFVVWTEIPEDLKPRIEKITYIFDHPSINQPIKESGDPSNGYSVSYRGWGCLYNVVVKISLKDDSEMDPINFDMCKAIGWT